MNGTNLEMTFQRYVLCALCSAVVVLILESAAQSQDAPFHETIIADNLDYPYGIAVGDIDRDGDPDITISDAWTGSDLGARQPAGRLFAVENLEDERTKLFKIGQVDEDGEGGAALLERHRLVDINGDGYLDVVAVLLDAGRVIAFINPAHSQFDSDWAMQILAYDVPTVVEVNPADIDGDGKIDIVISGRDGSYGWLDGSAASDNNWPHHAIKHPDRDHRDSRTAIPADLDEDGDIDIVGSFMNRQDRRGGLLLFENLRDGKSWRETVLFEGSSDTYHISVVDIDFDGYQDILVPQENEILLLYGRGQSISSKDNWSVVRIPTSGVGSGTWFELGAADFDGDGDLDIAASRWSGRAESGDGGVYWFEAQPAGWQIHALRETWPRANSLGSGLID